MDDISEWHTSGMGAAALVNGKFKVSVGLKRGGVHTCGIDRKWVYDQAVVEWWRILM